MEFTTGFELQSQATRLRWTAFTRRRSEGKTGLSPSPVPCSKGINPGHPPGTPGTTPRRDWQHGLFPLQSPLLRESWLVSFPPLNYMLKFSGSSCVHQVQGKVSWGTLSVRRRRRFGEVEGGFSVKKPTPTLEVLPNRFVPGPQTKKRGVALAMVSGDRLTTPASNDPHLS